MLKARFKRDNLAVLRCRRRRLQDALTSARLALSQSQSNSEASFWALCEESDPLGARVLSFNAELMEISQRNDLEIGPEFPSCLSARSKAPADKARCHRLLRFSEST